MKTELAIIGALIVYIALVPKIQMVSDVLQTPIGKMVALGIVVFVWKRYSPIVAVLLLVAYLRCGLLTYGYAEMFDVPAVACSCPGGMTFDQATGKCKNDKGDVKDPIACSCPSGYAYDGTEKKCIQNSEMSTPLPVEVPKTGPPSTTPGAAQEAIAKAAPPPTTMGGVQPTTDKKESFSPY
jgi:hypothetical protein